ncbi:MAG: arylesterase [Desulfobulbaceae bacterium]|jgi:lysophospholipase L1-like esterase|nr:arylesterase [Desulfobulbaceae bacterium]MDH3783390.1 arylesterase [Desulfobulbaceae bacterium]MDH3866958.1 arylesterase [Desulfobulbaceae bacterium]PLX46647.1 MAG: arylesterase [Desulfobulbaceae bacterium]HKJ13914.1 arylesterase [Desulfobulbales bacterium]
MHTFLWRNILPLLLASLLLTACGGPEPVTLRGDNIICFGDSLTFGTGAPRDKSYPAQLAEMIGQPVINSGIPGDTTDRALRRLERDVLSKSPRIVLITLGGNDLKNGVNKKTAFKNLKDIVDTIQASGALVVFGGIRLLFWDRGYEEEYEKLAAETGALLVPDILGGLMGHEELMHDTIHPNGAGYKIMAQKFYTRIEPYL